MRPYNIKAIIISKICRSWIWFNFLKMLQLKIHLLYKTLRLLLMLDLLLTVTLEITFINEKFSKIDQPKSSNLMINYSKFFIKPKRLLKSPNSFMAFSKLFYILCRLFFQPVKLAIKLDIFFWELYYNKIWLQQKLNFQILWF